MIKKEKEENGMTKRILSMLAVLLMLCGMLMLTAAAEELDLDRTGSISFDMTFQHEPVPGGSLTLYRVAEVGLVNETDYGYILLEPFAASGVSLEDLSAAETAAALAVFAADNGIEGVKNQIDEKGHISFPGLALGLYLLVQEDAAPGYEAARPFLVTVPGQENGAYVYDVNASPKLQLEQAPTEPTEPPTVPPTEPTEPELPQTGQTNWPVPVMGILGVVLIVFGIALRVSAKRDPYEN